MAGHSKWSNIKHRKGAQDKKRSQLFTKLAKEVTIAAKEGGKDLNFNPRLRLALDKAKKNSMPKDNIDRAIKKGTGELAGVEYIEIRYEGYGPGGTAFIVEVVTENKNRSASSVRSNFSKNGGNMGSDGAVAWMFDKKGQIIMKSKGLNGDEFMMEALEMGADDLIVEGDTFEILTDPTELQVVLEGLTATGHDYEEAEIVMLPKNMVKVEDLETAEKVLKLYEALEDNEDVNDVYANFDISDELIEQIIG